MPKGTKSALNEVPDRTYYLKTWRLRLMKINSKSTSETIRASCAFDTFDRSAVDLPPPRPGGYCFGCRSSFEEEKRHGNIAIDGKSAASDFPRGLAPLRDPLFNKGTVPDVRLGRRDLPRCQLVEPRELASV